MSHKIRTLALAALLPLAFAQAVLAQAPTPGERWRTTMGMEAMGMKMPGMTTEVCAPKNADNSPPLGNEDCQAVNQRRSGNTLSFDMQCKDGMTGTMELTQEGPNKWSGRMTANTKEGQMTMTMRSEKLPGECDASAMERKMNQMIAKSNAQQAQACLEAARGGSVQMFVGATAACTDKASVDAFCGYARSMKGYNGIARQQRLAARGGAGIPTAYRTSLADSGRLCGFAPETVRAQHCGTAQSKKEWTFFAEECPELANPIGQRECAGRDFTNPVAPAFADFCSAWSSAVRSGGTSAGSRGSDEQRPGTAAANGSGSSSQGAGDDGSAQPADAPKPTDKAKEALKKGSDALKGLFGR